MKRGALWGWIAAGALAASTIAPAMNAQTGAQGQKQVNGNSQSGQSAKPQNGSKPAQDNGNPFPENEESVPVMPSASAPDFSADMNGQGRAAAPAIDNDPVRSPDDAKSAGNDTTQGFSSSRSGLANVNAPPPDENQGKHGKGKDDSLIQPFPQASSKEDLSVGNYYMDIKDWRGALSRFESALVLAPDNPDVYWGLAECERHLGQFAQARMNYTKVMEYDPGSHHAKEARKALRDPQIANAKLPPQAQK